MDIYITLKDYLKKNLPIRLIILLRSIRRFLGNTVQGLYEWYLIKSQPHKYAKILRKLKNKRRLKVAFFAIHESVWKYDSLYQLMATHPRFEPIIVVCPVVNYGMDNMLVEMDNCYNAFKKKGYNVVRTYDIESELYLDVKKEINPDIVFYTNPYKGLIDDRYFITNFLDRLTCYVSYNFGNSNVYDVFHDLLMHNLVWKLFAETEEHKLYSVSYARNKGRNVEVTGYPGVDKFLDKSYHCTNIWKNRNSAVKRIIWAPHHTFLKEKTVCYSCFLQYYQYMFDLAYKYRDKIQIAFKPHPLLRVKLEHYWGKEKTDEYYAQWANLPNGMLADGEYTDLFLSSDAMIHDCGSFLIEYLYTLKPVLRTDNEIDPKTEFNDFAIDALERYYHARNKEDIEAFVINVINGVDVLYEKRADFYKQKLLPPKGNPPSQNILDVLEQELG